MEATYPSLLADARCALEAASFRVADLVRSLGRDSLEAAVPGSEWTVRQVAVHLITGAALAGDIATGMPSPLADLAPTTLAADSAQRIADIPESDPKALAGLVGESVQRLLQATSGRRGNEIVVWHGRRRIQLAHLVCISLGEQLIHGADMAEAARRPWAVDPRHAGLVVAGYAAVDEAEFQPAALQGRTSWTSP